MGLGFLGLLFVQLISFGAFSAPCPSGSNFQETYTFLDREEADLPIPIKLKYAEEVSSGCEGSAKRFKKIFTLLNNSGVSIDQSLKKASDFSHLSDEQTRNFIETFQKIFLKKYFDFDFKTAYSISLELSQNIKEGANVLREDFLKLVNFCLDEKGMTLPLKTCADISLRTVKLNVNSKNSIFDDWKECYTFLRKDSRLGLDQQEALKTLEQILKGGTGSCSNFKKTFDFATKEKGPRLDPAAALKIAQAVAQETKAPESHE